VELEWAHVIIGVLSAVAGGGAGLIAGVWRVARIQGRLELSFQTSIAECERRFEDKVDLARKAFDETLKGIRQKINDVELNTERNFVGQDDFSEFRVEYRKDIERIFDKLDRIPHIRQ
jgi:hypothetical protein